jgi:hypothetical protein
MGALRKLETDEVSTKAEPGEGPILAQELARSYREMVDQYRREYKLSAEEAADAVDRRFPQSYINQLRFCPPEDLDWHSLRALEEHSPELAAERWEQIREAAEVELRTGHRAAKQVEDYSSGPWARARFLALRGSLIEDWQPRGAMEQLLIDQIAQAITEHERWLELANQRVGMECGEQARSRRERLQWQPPRLTEAEAVEQAMAMAERWNRVYIRNLRALRDLRRYNVVIQNAPGGQVNVAQQQVNVAGTAAK